MRILLAHSFYRVPGGEDAYVSQQRDLLATAHDVELIAHYNRDLRQRPTTWTRMTTGRPGKDEIEKVFERFRPDVVHIHNVYPALGPNIHRAASRRGVPVVFTVHNFRLRCPNGYMFTNGEKCRRCEGGNYLNAVIHDCLSTRTQAAGYASALWIHRFPMRLENSVTRFVAPSRFMQDRLRTWGFSDQDIVQIPNFTAIPRTVDRPGDHGLFAGRMSPEKGLDTLLDALKIAGDPPFVMAGDGPSLPDLTARTQELGLTRTRFVGRVERDEVEKLLREARFVTLPSLSEENCPLAALEALAFGRPLIASALGGLVELTDDGRGLSVAPGDAAALGDAIKRLMERKDGAEVMGAKAHSFAQACLSPDAHLAALTHCYQSVLGAGNTPA